MGADTAARQARRRRAASRRCEALPDGRRDPLDKPRAKLVITVRAIGKNTVEFTDCDRAVRGAIDAVGARFQRSPRGGAWLVQQASADDVMVLLETRGYILQVGF